MAQLPLITEKLTLATSNPAGAGAPTITPNAGQDGIDINGQVYTEGDTTLCGNNGTLDIQAGLIKAPELIDTLGQIIVCANGTTKQWSALSQGSANQYLRSAGAGALPVFTTIDAAHIGGGAVSNTEFGYLDGVTSAIQTQLNGKQSLDATLTALAAYNTNGLLTQTAADTFTGRTLTGTSDKIDVTNGNGVSGNPTITISATYVGQTSITTLGTITTGTVPAARVSAGTLQAGAYVLSGDLSVDNLKLDGNVLSTTNTNGNLILTPNGSGFVQLSKGRLDLGDGAASTGILNVYGSGGSNEHSFNGDGNVTLCANAIGYVALVNAGKISKSSSALLIESTQTNGDINIDPNGTGKIVLVANTVVGTSITAAATLHVNTANAASQTILITESDIDAIGEYNEWSNIVVGSATYSSLRHLIHASARGGIAFHCFNGSSNAEQMRITGDGRLGLGDTAPDFRLDVAGDIRAQGTSKIYLGGTGAGDWSSSLSTSGGASTYYSSVSLTIEAGNEMTLRDSEGAWFAKTGNHSSSDVLVRIGDPSGINSNTYFEYNCEENWFKTRIGGLDTAYFEASSTTISTLLSVAGAGLISDGTGSLLIQSTQTNDNIKLDPNGTGTVLIDSGATISGTLGAGYVDSTTGYAFDGTPGVSFTARVADSVSGYSFDMTVQGGIITGWVKYEP